MVPDHDRYRHRLILRFIHLIVGPGMPRIKQDPGFVGTFHLQPVKTQVPPAGFGIFRYHQARTDERPAVADSRLMNRHFGDIDFITRHDFLLNRPCFHETGTAELFSAANKLRDHFIARHAERHRRERDIARRLPQTAPARIIRQIFKQETPVARLPQ